MNAVEIRGLTKSFRGLYALDKLDMTVPAGAIYGFIGENGSGKSTTEKLICGHLVPDSGKITLFGRSYKDAGVRAKVGALIENAGCFPESSVYQNLKMQAINLGIDDPDGEIMRVLKTVRMDGEAKLKFKKCSLGMKQRTGIAMALLGDPALLILDEPINGLDADGCRIMREVLADITRNTGCTVLISSHILGELEKIATHYGIIREGKMLKEISAKEMEGRTRDVTQVKVRDIMVSEALLKKHFADVREEDGSLFIYGAGDPEKIAAVLLKGGIAPSKIKRERIGLEEYYGMIMKGGYAV